MESRQLTSPAGTTSDGSVVTVPLTQGLVARIDAADAPRVLAYRWHPLRLRPGQVYAQGWVDGRKVYMHRFILEAPAGAQVDHRDHDGLHNVRANLRLCTHVQNRQYVRGKPQGVHTSQYLGVSWSTRDRKWVAYIRVDKRPRYLGRFTDEAAAARAHDTAAREHYGQFATCNFQETT